MASVSATINSLKRINQIQEDAIGKLEAYERTVSGGDSLEVRLSGYVNGYASELGYLRLRRLKLDLAIASVEEYARRATSLLESDKS